MLSPWAWEAVYSGISKLPSPAIAKWYLWKDTNPSNKPRQPTCVTWFYFHFSSYFRDSNRQKDRSVTLQATGLTKATPPRKGMQFPFLKKECPDRGIYWTGRKWGPFFNWSQHFLNKRNMKPWSTCFSSPVLLSWRPSQHWHLALSDTGYFPWEESYDIWVFFQRQVFWGWTISRTTSVFMVMEGKKSSENITSIT